MKAAPRLIFLLLALFSASAAAQTRQQFQNLPQTLDATRGNCAGGDQAQPYEKTRYEKTNTQRASCPSGLSSLECAKWEWEHRNP